MAPIRLKAPALLFNRSCTSHYIFAPVPEIELHRYATWAELALGTLTFLSLFVVTAPYGRHARKGWGPEIDQRL